MNTMKKIVVGIDFSESSRPVLEAAQNTAQQFGATVDLVHVREPFSYPLSGASIPDPECQVLFNWIDESLASAARRFVDAGIPCVTSSLEGAPASQIVAHAEKTGADLVIVGTDGRSGIAHAVLGSVAERVVQKAHRPVLVVPAQRT